MQTLFLLLSLLGLAGSPASGRAFERVVLISVDGLRSDALIAEPEDRLPAFARLRRGASTLNARTDPDFTVTLPNHTSMLTGRPVLGPEGHGWVENDDPRPGATLATQKGSYVAGIFDVAHDRGARTAMIVGKSKFSLYASSWGAEHGARDEVEPDDGRKKLDAYASVDKTAAVGDGILRELAEPGRPGRKALVFAHFAATDLVAHAYGWDVSPGSKYLKTLGAVDAAIGRVLDAIEADEGLRGRTAVILTTDHGGGAPFNSHDQPHMWVDYVIPFLVWTGDGGTPRDLYELNAATRKDPGIGRPATAASPPPVRNGDAGNLALSLLGLPAVPGSTLNAAQELLIEPRE